MRKFRMEKIKLRTLSTQFPESSTLRKKIKSLTLWKNFLKTTLIMNIESSIPSNPTQQLWHHCPLQVKEPNFLTLPLLKEILAIPPRVPDSQGLKRL